MKFASLVFLLVPFVANAADLCVEDNISKCKDLGYTESSCPYGGVACQYDTSLWYCAKWTCADGRLYSAENKPNDTCSTCIETAYKDMTCYDCTEKQVAECTNKNCAIGDVYYSDGTCCPVENFDCAKTPVGVVYALSATKGGMPYTTAQAEANGFTAQHGRVINLRDLTSDKSTYAFDPENPYDNNFVYLKFGLYNTDVSGLTSYTSDTMLTAFKNNEAELYSGKENTVKFANATPTNSNCTNGSYTKGSASYNMYCAPTVANAALSFYPPEVIKTHATVGVGNWYLPAIGEWALLDGINVNKMTAGEGDTGATGTTRKKVNNTLTALKSKGVNAATLTTSLHWSSIESFSVNDDYRSWTFTSNGFRSGGGIRRDNRRMRVSLEF